MILESRRVIVEPLCKAFINLLTLDNTNEDKTKIDQKLEQVGKVFSELMDVIEKKSIVIFSCLYNEYILSSNFYLKLNFNGQYQVRHE